MFSIVSNQSKVITALFMCVCISFYFSSFFNTKNFIVLNFQRHIKETFYNLRTNESDISYMIVNKSATFRRYNNTVRSLINHFTATLFSKNIARTNVTDNLRTFISRRTLFWQSNASVGLKSNNLTDATNPPKTLNFTEASKSLPVSCQSLLVPSKGIIAGLANNMWIYASAYSIARRNGMILKLWKSFDLASAFQLDYNQTISDEEYNSITWSEVTDLDFNAPCCSWMLFHEEISNLSLSLQPNCVRLTGYFQSWHYFHEYENDIRRQFSFANDVTNQANKFLYNARTVWEAEHINLTNASNFAIAPIFVGIHMRLGDWRNVDQSALQSYIRDAIFYFAIKFSHVIFVVCSNDIDWCRDNVRFSKELRTNHSLFYSVNYDRVTDLAILSKCNHSIITYGTYGWWSAYLTGGITLYYHRTPLFIGFSQLLTNESHYFNPGWIPY